MTVAWQKQSVEEAKWCVNGNDHTIDLTKTINIAYGDSKKWTDLLGYGPIQWQVDTIYKMCTENLAPENLDFQVPQLTPGSERKYVNILSPTLFWSWYFQVFDWLCIFRIKYHCPKQICCYCYVHNSADGNRCKWNPKSYLLILNIMWDMAISQHIFSNPTVNNFQFKETSLFTLLLFLKLSFFLLISWHK